MKKYILGAVFSFALLASPMATHAAGLTSAQVQSILSLLSSFGAEQSVINKVSVALTGNASAGASGAWCHTFNVNLKMGDGGAGALSSEVQYLQTSLIQEGFSGAYANAGNRGGSYFDESTAAAVTGFQQKYASEILTPNGLKYGTGYVGASTRAKLNKLYGCSTKANNNDVISFLATSQSGAAPLPVTFKLSLGGEQSVQGYSIDFGDGTASGLTSACNGADGGYAGCSLSLSAQHTYTSAGTYTATVKKTPGVQKGADIVGTSTITVSGGVATALIATISMLTPSGGEAWVIGQTYTFKWNSVNVRSDRKINLDIERQDATSGEIEVFTGIANDGSENWTIPSTIKPGKYIASIGACDRMECGPSGRSNVFNVVGVSQ